MVYFFFIRKKGWFFLKIKVKDGFIVSVCLFMEVKIFMLLLNYSFLK